MAAGATLIDVRDASEHRHGAIPGSILIPVDELRDRLDEVPHGPVVIHCAVGVRGHTARGSCASTAGTMSGTSTAATRPGPRHRAAHAPGGQR